MELALNLGWLALATVMCWLWPHHARREGPGRQVQFIALASILAMMFVVISFYDDMAMAQSSTEASCFQRDEFSGLRAQVVQHPIASFGQPFFDGLTFKVSYHGVTNNHPAPALRSPSLGFVQNRPPPSA